MKSLPHIFINYSSKGRSRVEKIHLALKAAGFNVWREQTRLDPDRVGSREIAFALADCGVVCLMSSRRAAVVKWAAPEKSKKDKRRKRKE
jgi:hypothetical protein